MSNRFHRYELRTFDPDRAHAFYADVLGSTFWGSGIDVTLLPAQAAARGAPAHWLGHIGVTEVTGTSERLLAAGATPLGPPRPPAGHSPVILKDPFGAIVALSTEPADSGMDRVAWHQLNVADESAAFAWYAGFFHWTPLHAMALPFEGGRQQTMTWAGASAAVGAVTNAASLPHVHAHWLFYFRTPDIESALDAARAHGARQLGLFDTAAGVMAPCEDAQGAMFALLQKDRG